MQTINESQNRVDKISRDKTICAVVMKILRLYLKYRYTAHPISTTGNRK